MESQTEFTCYHGTSENNYKKNSEYFKVKKYLIGQEVAKANKGKIGKKPGSLGYGIYVYKEQDLAMGFSKKKNDDPLLVTLKVKNIDKLVILDFNDIEEQDSFHKFRNDSLYVCKKNYGRLIGSNLKQHEMDGILIELYISNLIKNTKDLKDINIVKSRTYTPLDNETAKTYSFVPNGTEFCLRANNYNNYIEVIKSETVEGVS